VRSTRHSDASAVTVLTVRACCVILHDGQVALIHRPRPGGDQYSLPGGLVHADEQVPAALARQLNEELGLDVTALPCRPELRWVQDQLTTRPGSTDPFRRLHLVHVLPDLSSSARHAMPAAEQDAEDCTRIVWEPIDQAAGLHLPVPAAGAVIQGLASAGVLRAPVLLPPITDQSYRWR
jgi:8-oxo-dGTP pyrophosphatase MutT (NUDIX family)